MPGTDASQSVIPAAGTVCLRGDDILLIQRRNPPLAGEWSLPGGRIEYGEKAADAALRELREETGIEARLVGLVDVVDGLFLSPETGEVAGHYILVEYAAIWVSGVPRAGDDASHAAWISPAQLGTLSITADTRQVITAAGTMIAERGGG